MPFRHGRGKVRGTCSALPHKGVATMTNLYSANTNFIVDKEKVRGAHSVPPREEDISPEHRDIVTSLNLLDPSLHMASRSPVAVH